MLKKNFIFLLILVLNGFTIDSQNKLSSYEEELELGNTLFRSDLNKAIVHYNKAIEIAKKNKSKEKEIDATTKLGLAYAFLGGDENYGIAINKIKFSQEESKKIGYTKGLGMSYLRLGVVRYFKNNFGLAIKCFYKTIPLLEKAKDTLNIIGTYQNIALLFSELEHFKESIKANEKALSLAMDSKNTLKIIRLNSNIGHSYLDQRKPKEALKQFNLVDSLLVSFDSEATKDLYISNLAGIASSFYYLKDYKKAKAYAKSAIKSLKEKGFNSGETSNLLSLVTLGGTHLELKELKQAEKYYKHLEKLLSAHPDLFQEIPVNRGLSRLYKEKREYKKAYNYSVKWKVLSDSLRKIKTISITDYQAGQFEAEKKNNEINKQELIIKDQELKLIKKEEQNKLFISLALLSFLISFLTYSYFKSRQTKKNNQIKILTAEKRINTFDAVLEGEEKERNRIAENLHDGVNGDLCALKFKLVHFFKENNGDKVELEKSILVYLDEIIVQVRSLSHNLAPASLLGQSLNKVIANYCQNISGSRELEVHFETFGEVPELPINYRVSIYRIFQELMANVIKHAQASNVLVQVSYNEETLSFTVEDDGIGFDLNLKKGLGLRNLASRIEFLQGSYNIKSDSNGTAITFSFDMLELLKKSDA